MVARKVGVLILVALAVFAGSGGGWEVAKRWRRGWIEATATLVVSKLLMTVVFLIGVSAMGKSDAKDGMSALSDAMAGIVVMVLVLLCPYATYKFVHWATDNGGHDDLHRTGVAGVAVAAGAAKTAASMAMQVGTGTPAPQGPAKVPGMGQDGVASGIDPSGRFSKEGIDAGPPSTPSTFRFGENPNAGGDRGRGLIQRPGIPALITRAPSGEGDSGSESGGSAGQSAASPAQGAPVSQRSGATAHAPGTSGSAPSGPPAPPVGGPPPQGSPAPQRFVFPQQPPSGS